MMRKNDNDKPFAGLLAKVSKNPNRPTDHNEEEQKPTNSKAEFAIGARLAALLEVQDAGKLQPLNNTYLIRSVQLEGRYENLVVKRTQEGKNINVTLHEYYKKKDTFVKCVAVELTHFLKDVKGFKTIDDYNDFAFQASKELFKLGIHAVPDEISIKEGSKTETKVYLICPNIMALTQKGVQTVDKHPKGDMRFSAYLVGKGIISERQLLDSPLLLGTNDRKFTSSIENQSLIEEIKAEMESLQISSLGRPKPR